MNREQFEVPDFMDSLLNKFCDGDQTEVLPFEIPVKRKLSVELYAGQPVCGEVKGDTKYPYGTWKQWR